MQHLANTGTGNLQTLWRLPFNWAQLSEMSLEMFHLPQGTLWSLEVSIGQWSLLQNAPSTLNSPGPAAPPLLTPGGQQPSAGPEVTGTRPPDGIGTGVWLRTPGYQNHPQRMCTFSKVPLCPLPAPMLPEGFRKPSECYWTPESWCGRSRSGRTQATGMGKRWEEQPMGRMEPWIPRTYRMSTPVGEMSPPCY